MPSKAILARIKLVTIETPRPIEWRSRIADMPLAKKDPQQGDWLVACNGTEVPFTTRNRRRLLYCWQPSTGNHAYLDLDTDLILSDKEAEAAMGMS